MRGESRDYVPTRQKGVKESTCKPSDGCAFKAKASKRDPYFKQKGGKLNETAEYMPFGMEYL